MFKRFFKEIAKPFFIGIIEEVLRIITEEISERIAWDVFKESSDETPHAIANLTLRASTEEASKVTAIKKSKRLCKFQEWVNPKEIF